MQIESLEPRRLLAGVTILTHGYQGNITGWIKTTAADMTARLGGASKVTTSVMTMGRDSNGNLAVTDFVNEHTFRQTSTGEFIVKLDWSSVSDGSYSTGDVGQVAADYLMTATVNGMTLASLPMHLIGHSRGASLITAMVHDLGKAGVWVDQQTSLDAHPVDGVNDFAGASFGDDPMATYDNVIYADSYWRTDGDVGNLDFDGEPVAGAKNVDLNNSVQQNFIGSAHMSVPSYYNGTIDLNSSDGGDTPILSSWYGSNAGKPARDATGFYYTAIAGGLRDPSGLWSASNGSASRIAAGKTGEQWANVADVRVLGGRSFVAGKSIKLRYIREDRDGNSTVAFFLDRDTNPFNDNSVRTLRQTNLTEADAVTANRATGSTSGAAGGTYWVQARITDRQGHVRFAYSKSFKLTGGAQSQSFEAPSAGNPTTPFAGSAKSKTITESLEQLA